VTKPNDILKMVDRKRQGTSTVLVGPFSKILNTPPTGVEMWKVIFPEKGRVTSEHFSKFW